MAVFGSSDESVNVRITSSSDNSGINSATQSLDKFGDSADAKQAKVADLKNSFVKLSATAAAAGFAFNKMTDFMGGTITSANNMQSAMIGLNTVAKAFGKDADEAQRAAQDLAKDGLMTVSDAAMGLKNLLASGFELPQAIKLMERFKDTASFNRQASLGFGEAIRSATEGIKNGNSILVDNAGVTKNLSVILEEAGYSSQDLMKATTDTNVRLALFNGLIKETNPQLGDAARLAETAAGSQAMYAAKTEVLRASIGEALQPALLKLLETVTPLIQSFTNFAQNNPTVVASILLVITAGTALVAVLAGLGAAIVGTRLAMIAMEPALLRISTAFATARGTAAALNLALTGFTGFAAIATAAALATVQIVRMFNALSDVNRLANEVNKQQNSMGDGTTAYYESLKKGVAEGRFSQGEANRRMSEYNKNFQTFTGRASGGHVQAGKTYQVNEEGMELFTPNRSGQVIPARQSAEIIGGGKVGGGGSSITNVFNVYPQTASAVDRLFEKIDRDNELESKGLTPMRAV